MTPKEVPFLDLTYQTNIVSNQVLKGLEKLMTSHSFIRGDDVSLFETRFSQYLSQHLNAPLHVLGVANGTDALSIALQLLDIGPGDEVITTPFTFAAPIEAILQRGAVPVLCDIDPSTLLIDLSRHTVVQAFGEKTKAILPVHLFGKTVPPRPLIELKSHFECAIIEDAAQAHGSFAGSTSSMNPFTSTTSGSSDRPIFAGTYGDVSIFSFHPTKNLGAFGDAGAIAMRDYELADRAKAIANHGSRKKYYHEELGMNSRLDTLQAIVLHEKLRYLEIWNNQRRHIAKRYIENLSSIPKIDTLTAAPGDVFHLFVIRILDDESTRSKLMNYLNVRGVGTKVYYPYAIHQQPAFADKVKVIGNLEHAVRATEQLLALPCYPGLSLSDIDSICERIESFFSPRQSRFT